MRRTALLLVFALSATSAACTPSIGDRCTLNTDCSIQGDRQCDVSQELGYCTVFNCGPNACPEKAACVAVQAAVPGCRYDDRVVARTARSLCLKRCERDTDCRVGYVCVSPRDRGELVLDDDQGVRTCSSPPRASFAVPEATPDAPVCQRGVAPDGGAAPFVDGGAPPDLDGGDAGADADAAGGADADAAGGLDAGAD